QVPRLMLAWNGTRAYAADEPAGDVLATILGGGKASRLYRTLVLDKQVATNVFAYDSALLLGGYFAIYGDAKAGHTGPELLAGPSAWRAAARPAAGPGARSSAPSASSSRSSCAASSGSAASAARPIS